MPIPLLYVYNETDFDLISFDMMCCIRHTIHEIQIIIFLLLLFKLYK
jgi:hypothetical protein